MTNIISTASQIGLEAIVFIASLPENAVVHEMVMRPIVETNF